MPLKNKHLKYTPEITLEIFTLVWNKLIESGFKHKYDNELRNEFKCFKDEHNCLIIDNTYFNTSMSLYIINGLETTVQEILGYDPFVKEEVSSEYVECINDTWSDNDSNLGKIFKVEISKNYSDYIPGYCIKGSANWYRNFKPSTKEAYNLQQLSKSIEKWSVGSYVVFLKGFGNSNVGDVDQIKDMDYCGVLDLKIEGICKADEKRVKWFATKSEAEEFAKTLVKPVKEKVKTPQLDLNEWLDKYKKLNLAVNDLANAIELANFDKVFLKLEGTNSKEKANILYDLWNPKQLLKQAVHCKTQEEYRFAKEKTGAGVFMCAFIKNDSIIPLDKINITIDTRRFKAPDYDGYELLSFQEWCYLNGYKMGKEVKFIVGKWYKIRENEFIKFSRIENCIDYNKVHYSEIINKIFIKKNDYIASKSLEKYALNNPVSIEEIQQYLPDNHPDKITPVIQQTRDIQSEFKVGDWVCANGENHTANNNSFLKDVLFKISEIDTAPFKHYGYSYISVDKKSCPNYRGITTNTSSIRHATPEEINNHLTSIRQTPDLGKQKFEKYPFKPLQPGDLEWEIEVPELWKPKMLLSIDDEELPMVNIIKTNTIKQLLNND